MRRALCICGLLFLSACVSQGSSDAPAKPTLTEAELDAARAAEYQRTRYHVEEDFFPLAVLTPENMQDAIPREEPIRKAGNKSPYTVLGKTYEVMSLDAAKQYKERGGASWYGMKFHGHNTSNGEIYNVYAMTAAHKTLPIPSYALVTNVANGKQVVVRVNDRGPFHSGRIIDLSYAAATKLGYITTGTAEVTVEAIDPIAWHQRELMNSPIAASDKSVMLQVAAFSDAERAQQNYQKVQGITKHPVLLEQGADTIWRLKVGPLPTSQADLLGQNLQSQGFAQPFRIELQQ